MTTYEWKSGIVRSQGVRQFKESRYVMSIVLYCGAVKSVPGLGELEMRRTCSQSRRNGMEGAGTNRTGDN